MFILWNMFRLMISFRFAICDLRFALRAIDVCPKVMKYLLSYTYTCSQHHDTID